MAENKAKSLNDVCYEQIKDNFYYGLFGDFKLVVDKSTGCFNATKLCQSGGKQFSHWTRLEKSKSLKKFFESQSCPPEVEGNFYEIRETNNDSLNKQITGQFVPKEFILEIASWISPKFYLQCNSVVTDYFVKEYKSMDQSVFEAKLREVEELTKNLLEKDNIIAEKEDKIDELIKLSRLQEERSKQQEEERRKDREMLRALGVNLEDVRVNLEDVKDQNNELLEIVEEQTEQLDTQHQQLTTIQTKLEIAVEDRAPQPKQSSKQERFILLRRDCPAYPYYTIRAQNTHAKTALKRQRDRFSGVTILMDIHYHPNSKTLYTRVKEDLKSRKVAFKGCSISIEDSKPEITEAELVAAMQTINDEKLNVNV